MDLLTLLKLDLSIRPDNTLWGSGLGGNPSELFYVLNRNTYFSIDNDFDDVIFQESDNDFSIICGANIKLIPLRERLTKYLGYVEEMSFSELVSAVRFGTVNTNSQDILDLRDCMLLSDKLYDILYNKEDARMSIREEFQARDQDLVDRYGKYIKYNEHMLRNTEGGLSRIIDRDPIWGAQRMKLQHMAKEKILNLLTGDEIELMKDINKYPPYVTFLCARLLIGTEWLSNYPLDKYINNFIIASEGFKVK